MCWWLRDIHVLTTQGHSCVDHSGTFMCWPLRDIHVLTTQGHSCVDHSGTFMCWPLRDIHVLTSQGHSCVDHSGTFICWPLGHCLWNLRLINPLVCFMRVRMVCKKLGDLSNIHHHCAAMMSHGWVKAQHAASISAYLALSSARWYPSSSRLVHLSIISPVSL